MSHGVVNQPSRLHFFFFFSSLRWMLVPAQSLILTTSPTESIKCARHAVVRKQLFGVAAAQAFYTMTTLLTHRVWIFRKDLSLGFQP